MINKTAKSIIVTLIGLLLLTSVGLVAAAPSTTKSSPLYSLKKAIEAASLVMASNDVKAIKQAEQVDTRLNEVKLLEAKVAELEVKQKLQEAAKVQATIEATKQEAIKTTQQVKNNLQLISQQSTRQEIENKITKSEQELYKNDQDGTEEVEVAEPKEKAEQEQENEQEDESENESNENNDGSGESE